MRLGATVHSASPVAAERPQWLYLKSWETYVCRLRRTSSDVGRGANQSYWGVSVVGGRLMSSEVGESDSMESPVVMCCVLVSAMTNTRLWRAPMGYGPLCAMEGPSPLSYLADGGIDELAGRIVAANVQGLVVRAFPGNMGT